MLTLLKTMQELGVTTGELRGEYIRLVEALLKNIETEKIKRETSDTISAIDDVISTFEVLVDEIGLADSAIGKMVENAKSAISTFKGLQGSIKTILETTSSGKGGSGIDTAAIMSQASSYAAVITIVITMIKLMANEMKKANDAAYSLVDMNTKK
jgi:hypothetical protein